MKQTIKMYGGVKEVLESHNKNSHLKARDGDMKYQIMRTDMKCILKYRR
mgnify:CR=1 FL=1